MPWLFSQLELLANTLSARPEKFWQGLSLGHLLDALLRRSSGALEDEITYQMQCKQPLQKSSTTAWIVYLFRIRVQYHYCAQNHNIDIPVDDLLEVGGK